MASELLTQIREAAEAIRRRTTLEPKVGIILGTGLGDFANAVKGETVIPYRDIPHFPVSTVESRLGFRGLREEVSQPPANCAL